MPTDDDPLPLAAQLRALWKPSQGANALLWTLVVRLQRGGFVSSLAHGYVFLGCMFLDPILLEVLWVWAWVL